jgi:hypothetical protein
MTVKTLSFMNFFMKKITHNTINAEDHPDYKKRSADEVGLHSHENVKRALETDTTSKKIMAKNDNPKKGDLVGARLNLNVRKNTGVPVLTLHKGTNKSGYKKNKGFYGGKARAYQHTVNLHHAHFNVNQTARSQIATGQKPKFNMASVDGHYSDDKPSFDGVEARFNPKRHHLFVDSRGHAIRSAEHVTLHGDRAYLRGKIEYHTPHTTPKKVDDGTSTETKFK